MKIYNFPRVDLIRGSDHFEVPTRLDWRMLLVLAQAGGWCPNPEYDFKQAYLDAHDQVIDTAEARAIADALASILADIPDFDIPVKGRIILFEYFSGIRKAEVYAFIEFCRGGAFHITE